MATVDFPSQHAEYNGTSLYAFLCPATALRALVQVNRKVEDKDDGYQRAFSVSRAKDIGRYLRDGGVIPGSIIVSFDAAKFDAKLGVLQIPEKQDAGWVIDGQHRLEGAAVHAGKEIFLPVTAFVALPEDKQIELFVTINKEQKGVSSSLYLELLKRLPKNYNEAQAFQERAADLATLLKNDPKSPFHRLIVSTTAPKPGQISTTNFVRKVSPLIRTNGALSSYPDENRAKIISNLFQSLIDLFPKHKDIFFKTVGFGAIMSAFPTIHQLILGRRGPDFTITSFQELLRSIDYFDFGDWKQIGTGSAAEVSAGRDLSESLTKSNPVDVKT